MKLSSYYETYYNQASNSIKVRNIYVAHFKELTAYGSSMLEVITKILKTIKCK